jgi:hypothetical protein
MSEHHEIDLAKVLFWRLTRAIALENVMQTVVSELTAFTDKPVSCSGPYEEAPSTLHKAFLVCGAGPAWIREKRLANLPKIYVKIKRQYRGQRRADQCGVE